MSDANAMLQHILAAVEQIKASQTTLQQSHQELQTQFAASKVDLEAKLAALSMSLAPQQTPPLPESISGDALQILVGHPLLADQDRLYAQVLQWAHQFVTPDVDASILQNAYTELAQRIEDTREETLSAPQTPRSTGPSPGQPQSTVYVAKSGRRFDTRKPPPYPCHKCGHRHWAAGPGATPCPDERSGSFSRRGANSPASAPRAPSSAGQQ
jgi:hypothetical protein